MELKKVVRNISSQWIAHVIGAIAGILMPPFLVRHLGLAAYGIHNLVGDLGGYSALLYLGLGAAILKFVAEHKAVGNQQIINETVSTIFAVYLRLGVFCLVVALALMVPLPAIFPHITPALIGPARARLALIGCVILVEFWGSVFGGVLMGLQRFDILNGVKLALLVVRNAAIVTVVMRYHNVVAVGVVALVVSVAEQAILWAAAHRYMPGLRVSLSLYRPDQLRNLATFSAQSFLFTMSERLINYTDNIVIMRARGDESAGVYAFPLRLVEFAREALDRATHVLMPGVSEAAARGQLDRVRNLWITGNKVLLSLALPIALVQCLWGRYVLTLWIAREGDPATVRIVNEAWPCMTWLALACVMQMAGRGLARPILEGMGELKVPARIALAEGAANLVLSIILVRSWGIEGVAFATFLPAAFTGLTLMPWYACQKLGLSYARHVMDVFVRAVVPTVPACATLMVAQRMGWHLHLVTLAMSCIAVLVVQLVVAFAFTFTSEERQGIRDRFRR
jgi:O-antigen/teichoic acid export membrane protein